MRPYLLVRICTPSIWDVHPPRWAIGQRAKHVITAAWNVFRDIGWSWKLWGRLDRDIQQCLDRMKASLGWKGSEENAKKKSEKAEETPLRTVSKSRTSLGASGVTPLSARVWSAWSW
jgi:hypothetical protein